MAHIDELKADLATAEATKEALITERQDNRDTMSKMGFRAYNEETRAEQLEVEAAVTAAIGAITAHLNNSRQEIYVGTLSESDTVGGASG